MLEHHKPIPHVGINDIDALVLFKKLFFLPFFKKSKFDSQLRQRWNHIIISFLFMIGQHELVVLVGINGIDALDS